MTRVLTGGLALAACISVAALCVHDASGPRTVAHDAARLFDPQQMGASLCGGGKAPESGMSRLVALFGARAAVAATQAGEAPPLFDNLGDFSMKVTTDSPQAQAYFDQGVRLMFGFNHAEAIRAFKAAQRLDPGCAMCFWGEALSLGVNINAPMDPEASPPAWDALQKAIAAADDETGVEKALIGALESRYSADPKSERAALEAAYADAMKAVHERFPDNHEAAVFFAEAAMNTQPWDYWEADGVTPRGRIGPAVAASRRCWPPRRSIPARSISTST